VPSPASSQTYALIPQSRLPSYPARSVGHRARRSSHSARRCGNVPAPEVKREITLAPDDKGALAGFSSSTPATLYTRRRWCGGHRRDRFESAPAHRPKMLVALPNCPRPSLWATASWTIRACTRSGCARPCKGQRAAIVLHINRVVRQTERFCETVHQLSDVVEGISELLWVGPIAVSETRIIGRSQMVFICESMAF
jgi:hypothetical protein